MSQSDSAAQPHVIVIDPDSSRREPVALTSRGLTIGRDAGNDIVLSDPRVSRRHARVDWDGRQATVTDLASSNGTTVGSVRLTPHEPHPWSPSDSLLIESFSLELTQAVTSDIAAVQATSATLPTEPALPAVEPPQELAPPAVPQPAPIQAGGSDRRKWLTWGGIGCAGIIGLCVLLGATLGVIGVLTDSDDDVVDNEQAAATSFLPAATQTLEPTLTPVLVVSATGTPVAEQAVIAACGGTTIEYEFWEREIPQNIDQWNRIVEAANKITDAWNGFATVMDSVLSFESVVDNVAVIDAATTLITAIETNRPAIAAETDPDSKFGALAQAELNTADAIAELARLTSDAAGGNADAWNASLDQFETVGDRFAESDAATEAACEYFRSISD